MALLIYLLSVKGSFSKDNIFGDAENVTIDLGDQFFTAEGGSQIRYDDIVVNGNKIRRDAKTGFIIAEGGISYSQGKFLVTADTLELDIDNRIARVTNGFTSLNSYYLRAKFIEVRYPKIIKAKDAFVTTCALDEPHFRVEAKEVDFYPDSKYIARKGWIYIGKHFRLLPIPIYASYVVPQKDRAPLFPQISFDQAKGTSVVYGFDYEFLKKERFLGIEDVSLLALLTLEWSSKRSFGINRALAKYSMFENSSFVGEMEITDWLSSRKESLKDSETNNSGGSTEKEIGSSFNFYTKNEFIEDKGFLWKTSNGKYIFGPSKSKVEYRYTNSDLSKDSAGHYFPLKDRRQFSQIDLEINQKLLDIHNIKYRLRDLRTKSGDTKTLTSLLQQDQVNADRTTDRVAADLDTTTENAFEYSSNTSIHSARYFMERKGNLRPWSAKENKYKINNRDEIKFTLKPIFTTFSSIKSHSDSWSLRDLATGENIIRNYVSSESKSSKQSIVIGPYTIPWVELDVLADLGRYSNISYRFHNPTYGSASTSDIDPLEEHKNRFQRLINTDKEAYDYITFGVTLKSLRYKKIVAFIPNYEITMHKYDSPGFIGLSKYVDSLIHRVGATIPWVIYNNKQKINRSVDLSFEITPGAILSFYQGKRPKEQVRPSNEQRYDLDTKITIGNLKNTIKPEYLREIYSETNLLKTEKWSVSTRSSIDGQDFFSGSFSISSSWDEGEYDSVRDFPDNRLKINLSSNWYYVKVGFEHNFSELYSRQGSDKSILISSEQKASQSYNLTIFDVTAKYKYSITYGADEINIADIKNLREHEVSLGYELKKDKKRNFMVSTEGAFSLQYDRQTQEFRDSTLRFNFKYEGTHEEEEEKVENPYEFRWNKRDSFLDIDNGDEALEEIFAIGEEKRRGIKDLGRPIDKDLSVGKAVTKFVFGIKSINDVSHLQDLGGFNWSNYKNSWKQFVLNIEVQLWKYLNLEYKAVKLRDRVTEDFKEDTRFFSILLGLGRKGYEWWPGFRMKNNIKEDRIDEITGILNKSIHCTRIEFSLGKKINREKEFVWAFGFGISINAFPEKSIGINAGNDGINDFRFGI